MLLLPPLMMTTRLVRRIHLDNLFFTQWKIMAWCSISSYEPETAGVGYKVTI